MILMLCALLIGMAIGAAVTVVVIMWRRKPPPKPRLHRHDWHIGGKDKGKVRYECQTCQAVKY